MAVFGACGVIFLLSNIARTLGKAKQLDLCKAWGGLATTPLLRHRDGHIDPIAKQRYHSFLERKIKNTFPSVQEEKSNPEHADECYQAGVKWLLGKTRDKKTILSADKREYLLWISSKRVRHTTTWYGLRRDRRYIFGSQTAVHQSGR
jgi:hypothetical protein